MHYVQHFKINGVDTKQVACIELKGKPNAATEGSVGLLAIDTTSPLHEVYKCIGVEGSVYHWELLSSGTCIMSSIITGAGEELAEFPYDKLKTVANYVVKVGDVIIDKEGFLYQVESLGYDYCVARYNGTQIVSGIPKVGEVDNGKILSVVDGCHAFVNPQDTLVAEYVEQELSKVKEEYERKLAEVAPLSFVEPDENGEWLVEYGKVYRIYGISQKIVCEYSYNDTPPATVRGDTTIIGEYHVDYYNICIAKHVWEDKVSDGYGRVDTITFYNPSNSVVGVCKTPDLFMPNYESVKLYITGATKVLVENPEPYLR